MHTPMKGLLLVPNDACFTKVARVPLLHRALLAGRKAGIQEWLVLAWHEAQKVHASLASSAKLKGISWQVHDPQKTSPEAVLHALQAEHVLIVSCTAVFDHRTLRPMQHQEGTVLCVTASEVAGIGAASEGIFLQEGRVVAAPTIAQATHHATGILRCPGGLLARLMRNTWDAMQSSPTPISVLLHSLLQITPVSPVDISPYPWTPLTPPLQASVMAAEAQLVHGLGREGDSRIVRVIDRRMSQALTKRLVHTRLTPNHITLISALIGISGAILMAQPLRLWQVLGSLLFLFSTITDGCDGEIARLTFQESDFGAKLDVIMDNVVHVFLFACIALGLYRQHDQTLYLVLGGLALGGALVSMAMYVPYLWWPPDARRGHMRLHEHFASRDFAYALPLIAGFGKLDWFLWAATIGTYAFAAGLGSIYLFQWRQRSRARSHGSKTLP